MNKLNEAEYINIREALNIAAKASGLSAISGESILEDVLGLVSALGIGP